MPTSIVNDRDPMFTSLFWKELFKLHGTEFKFSSAYHPQTNGQTEIVNKYVEQYLWCFMGISLRSGHAGCLLQNGGIIPTFMLLLSFHHLRQFTDTHPYLCWLIRQRQLQFSLCKTP